MPEETEILWICRVRINACSLVQTVQTVSPSRIYLDEGYLHYSSYSASHIGGFQKRARDIAQGSLDWDPKAL